MLRKTTYVVTAVVLALVASLPAAQANGAKSKANAVMFNPQPDPPHFRTRTNGLGTEQAARGIVVVGTKALLPAVQMPRRK